MKKVTSWTQSSRYPPQLPYPGFATHAGFIVSTALVLALSGLRYLTSMAKDWL